MAKHFRKQKNCLNCGYTVDKNFCSNCGQENTEPDETFLHLVKEFYADIFHYDSKFFTSFKYLLFKPGELTRLYEQGKRTSYIHPFRMFFFLSVLLVLALEIPFSAKSNISALSNERRNHYAVKFYEGLHINQIPSSIDSLEAQQHARGETVNAFKHNLNEHILKLKAQGEEVYFEKHLEAHVKVMPKFYILMMPFIALFLLIAFAGTRFYFVNHLIFSFHFVSFIIILNGSYQLLQRIVSYIHPAALNYFPSEQVSFSIIFGISFIYLLLGIKRYYNFPWLLTTLRSIAVFALIIELFFVAGGVVAYYSLFLI